MTLLTQEQIETRMYRGGIDRATSMMARAEEAGEASRNPYAATIYRDFVLPLAEVIKADVASVSPGVRAAHIQLLSPLDADAVAYLAVRTLLNNLMGERKSLPALRSVASAVGASVHQELVLAQIQTLAPDLYHTLSKDFQRRKTKSVRHRMTVFKMQAAKEGIEWAEWPIGSRDQVGAYLLEQLERLGMLVIDQHTDHNGEKRRGKRTIPLEVHLTHDVLETISKIKGFISITSPMYGPCVAPPLDWAGMTGGGFHTEAMRRVHPYLVKAPAASRELLRDHEMPLVVRAVNHIQKTAWRVNTAVLEACLKLAQLPHDVSEVVSTRDLPKPEMPEWLKTEQDKADRTPYQQTQFMEWKGEMREWYTARKLRASKISRFQSAIKGAQFFRDYPELFFVYFLDSRGRVYPLTYGLNPQGSDLQKALLQFAVGKPLLDDDAKRWFCIHGANKWGFDKARLNDRAEWWRENEQMILAVAKNPVENLEWTKADSPMLFLAWCFEFAEWRRLGDDFESRIAVSMDGSCNGLQHFSAMLRDEVGGRATNLTDNADMQDIYRIVAEATLGSLKRDPSNMAQMWAAVGVERNLVKRSVMTTPYGVTKRTAVKYVIDDYLSTGKASQAFTPAEHYAAAQCVMHHAWDAISKVVVKSREAMDWLKRGASRIIKARGKDTEGVISWVTPSGFLATQAYYELEEHRVVTRIHGVTKVKVVSEGEEASPTRHASGLAPNFVHSCDAAHLHLTAAACQSLLIDALAMIHDDYGTHAADAQKLFTLIRLQFLDMYENHDPIGEFAALYPEVGEPPKRGSLNLKEVIYSDYFFS